MRRLSWLFAILFVCLAAPLLAQAQPSPPPDAATLEAAAVQSQRDLHWAPCAENAAVECATLILPLDYDKPRGATFELAVVRARALNPAGRIGTLFVHPGGHEPGVSFVLKGGNDPSFNRLRQRFDIVSLDPRGAGRSRPLTCDFDLPPLTGSDDATLQDFFDKRARLYAAQCLDEDRSFVLSISGNNFAHDIEQFRRALGERQLSFLMISNSGPVGAVYAALYPKHVRAMLLDSPVGPDFRDYNIERPAEQAAAQDLALGRVDQICVRTPSCPLRTTGVVAAFDTVRERLLDQPVTAPDASQVTADRFSRAIAFALSDEHQWPLVVVALTHALAENYALLAQQVPGGQASGDGFTARYCNDYGMRRAAADYQPVVEALGATYERFTSVGALAFFVSNCMAWPAADTPLIGNVQREVKTPILLLGSEFDTDTPFPWTKRLAMALGMGDTVVRYAGGGHVLSKRSDLPCITRTIDAYLFDLKLPVAGTVCPAAPFSAP